MLGTYLKEFGPWLLAVTSMGRVMRMFKFDHKILNQYDKFKHKVIISYLWKRYDRTLRLKLLAPLGGPGQFNYAFVLWWQGEDGLIVH